MKPIELTEEHKSKLLEMCKALFPEYKWEFCSTYGTLNDITQVDALIRWKNIEEHSQDYADSFHWFEFCLIHLYYELKRYGALTTDFNYPLHETKLKSKAVIIDILYEEYKKIKKHG